MKKALLTFICVLFSLTFCFADNGMGVKVMGNKNNNTDPVSVDNLVVGKEVEIEDYAIIKPTEFGFFDSLGCYNKGETRVNTDTNSIYRHKTYVWYKSENEADYAILRCDLTNTDLKSKDFTKNCTVKVIFNDKYQYEGWVYQNNYNNSSSNDKNDYILEEDKGKQNKRWAIDKADNFAIEPMYKGHYIFGCTLPNAVIESTKPLKMIITLDGNEITYNIRK